MSKLEIQNKYLLLHDTLTDDYYNKHLLTKAAFDILHGKIWNDMETELIAQGYIKPPIPSRDLAQEIDQIKERINILEVI